MLELQRRRSFASVISNIHIGLNFKPQMAKKGSLKMQGDGEEDFDGKEYQIDIPAMVKRRIYILNWGSWMKIIISGLIKILSKTHAPCDGNEYDFQTKT